ncbi:MAG: uncharacterized protein JWO79_2608 [Actinomycetia bacterium]|jgi:uncharacterized protein YkwD|nr:uncharacterized protein [Actinomycetes bacterium]MDQ1652566.1 hypothetical protein [Cryptosporangiaceae bacterium]MDQ1655582.1 hypothetical protein [Cryptosporangiaceae bacterium]
MRLVWRGSVVVALLALALGISWLPWQDGFKNLLASPKPSPSVGEPADAGGEALASTPDPGAADREAVAEVVARVNAERAKSGCQAVAEDPRLTAVAMAHSADMAQGAYFSHDAPDGTDPWKRATAAGYPHPLSENIAQGQQSAAEVMTGWLASSGHRANIVNCAAKAIGVGLARGRGGTPYWTQLFGA